MAKKLTKKQKAEHYDTIFEELRVSNDKLKQLDQDCTKKDDKIVELDLEILDLSASLEKEEKTSKVLRAANNEKQSQIDEQETKKMAEAFERGEKEYGKRESLWEKTVLKVVKYFLPILIVILFSFELLQVPLETRISFLSLSILGAFFIWFCVKQYSFYRNLRVDMNHRKILAQSYYNVLRSSEDQDIRPLLAEKVVEFLVTPPHTKEDKMGTPLESIIKSAIHGG